MDPYQMAISAGLSLGEGGLKHMLGRRANRKFAARRDAMMNAVRQQGQAAKGNIRAGIQRTMANKGAELQKRGMDSSVFYDAVLNDAGDRGARAEAEIDERTGMNIASIVANSPDPYDGNAMYASLTGLGRILGETVGGMGGAGGAAAKGGNTENQSLYREVEAMTQLPGGGPAVAPGGGMQISPVSFDRGSGAMPGTQGFNPYSSLLEDDGSEMIDMDGGTKPRKKKRRPSAATFDEEI